MNLEQLIQSLSGSFPPPGISEYAKALWYDAKQDWEKAHEIVQDIEDQKAAWVHAYLHRKEGDLGNASYWYHRAGRKMPEISVQEEWKQLAAALM